MSEAPAGLDDFIKSTPPQQRSAGPALPNEPSGLDAFIAPEMAEEKYGGASGMAKSFGLGAARTLSFGGFDQFLTNTGLMKPEDIKGYQEQNPFSSGAGEVAGIAGSIFAPEAGLLGAIAAPTRAVGGLGGAITKAVTPAAEGLAGALASKAANPTVNKIVSQGAAKFLGSGVETTAYSLGHAVSEDALGDHEALGEKLLPSLGTDFLLGGGIGSALGIAGVTVPAAIEKAGINTAAARDVAERAIAKAASVVSGKSTEDILPLVKGLGTKEGAALRKQAQEGFAERESTARELTEGLATQNETMNKAVKDYYKGARQEEISTLMKQVPHDVAYNAAVDTAGKFRSGLKEMRSEPELYSATGKVRQAELISEGLENKIAGSTSSEEIYHAVNDAKQQIATLSKFQGMPTDAERATVNKIKQVGHELKSHLENASVYGESGARQGALNSAYSDYASASRDFLKTFGKKMASGEIRIDPGKTNTFLGQMGRPGADLKQEILSDYLSASQGLAKQMGESAKNATSNVETDKLMDLFRKTQGIAEGAESELEAINQLKRIKKADTGLGTAAVVGGAAHMIGGPAAAAATEAAYAVYHTLHNPAELVRVLSAVERAGMKVTGAINKGVSSIFRGAEQLSAYGTAKFSAEERKNNHDKIADKLSQLNANPEQLIDKLQSSTAGISPFAPKITQGLQMSMTRATQFLQSKLPGNNISERPMSQKYQPSNSELLKWHKYFSAVENPTDVLKQVAAGTIGPEPIEALQAVYPKMLSEMQTAVLDKMTDHMSKDKLVPYRTKMALSLFLGQDMVNSLNPVSMLANQNMLATATQAKAAAQSQNGSVNQKNIGKIGSANRLLTDAQASAQRQKG